MATATYICSSLFFMHKKTPPKKRRCDVYFFVCVYRSYFLYDYILTRLYRFVNKNSTVFFLKKTVRLEVDFIFYFYKVYVNIMYWFCQQKTV